jgi:hypothetical protein
VVEKLLQFGFDNLFVFPPSVAIEQQLAVVWHHVVRMAAVDAGHRQAGVADQIGSGNAPAGGGPLRSALKARGLVNGVNPSSGVPECAVTPFTRTRGRKLPL